MCIRDSISTVIFQNFGCYATFFLKKSHQNMFCTHITGKMCIRDRLIIKQFMKLHHVRFKVNRYHECSDTTLGSTVTHSRKRKAIADGHLIISYYAEHGKNCLLYTSSSLKVFLCRIGKELIHILRIHNHCHTLLRLGNGKFFSIQSLSLIHI